MMLSTLPFSLSLPPSPAVVAPQLQPQPPPTTTTTLGQPPPTVQLLSSHRVAAISSVNSNAVAAAATAAAGEGPFRHRRASLVADNEQVFPSGGHYGAAGGGGGDGSSCGSWAEGGVSAHVFWPSSSGAGAAAAATAAQVWSVCVKMGGGVEERVEWEERGSVEVSNRRVCCVSTRPSPRACVRAAVVQYAETLDVAIICLVVSICLLVAAQESGVSSASLRSFL